ncbi:ATP-binding protein [Desulfonatronum sp. SC1]|uniref:ATP-binding protein n=1 Tax=Desulfonatronum sp. SC1 TaxID=2109626 RepID=UPI0013049F34|nr:ATP-binding protein [Desulfonatronum sp. SC1]
MPPPVDFSDSCIRRVSYLEEVNRASLQALQLVLEMGRQGTSLNRIDNPRTILAEFHDKIHQLIPWKAAAFYLMDEQTSVLNMALCRPMESAPHLSAVFDLLVEDRTMSLALHDESHTFVEVDGCEVLMHALNTITRCRGFFLGIPMDSRKSIPDTSLAIFSIMMQSAAQTLESYELYRLIRRVNSALEEKVEHLEEEMADRMRAEAEREKLQGQLLQAQKMESLGILAGGVAHDFNNLLQIMGGKIEVLLHTNPGGDFEAKHLRTVSKSIDRATALVRQLLVFGSKTEPQMQHIDLGQELKEIAGMLEGTIPASIRVELGIQNDTWSVSADPVQIEQIILNLTKNAVDAMPAGGRLAVETHNVTLDEEFVRSHMGAKPGRYVLLTVADTGVGIEPEVLRHVFDPFFTTKEVGKGTGLGLASVYGIVKAHGGYIQCASQRGQGTIFSVYLPVADQGREAKCDEPRKAISKGGNETILVVDDEPEIRELTLEALESFGYVVQCAASGEQALDVYQRDGKFIDLVLLDLSMPGMGGCECLQALLRLDPSAKVLIISGNAAKCQSKDLLLSGAKGFLGKPYHLRDLEAKVSEVLG